MGVFAVGGSLLVLWYLKHYAGKLIVTKHEEVREIYTCRAQFVVVDGRGPPPPRLPRFYGECGEFNLSHAVFS